MVVAINPNGKCALANFYMLVASPIAESSKALPVSCLPLRVLSLGFEPDLTKIMSLL